MIKNFKIFESQSDLNENLLRNVIRGDFQIVKKLIENGADVNYKSKHSGRSMLSFAIANNYLDIFKLLVENGANIETKDDFGNTSLHLKNFWSKKDIQEILLEKNPFNISILKKYNIPIHPDIKEEYYDLDLGSELGTI